MMKKSRVWGLIVASVALSMGLISCDWSATSEDESWSDRYNWVNFSGTYRGANGALLVSSYSTTPGANDGNVVTREVVQRGDGAKSSFNGTLAHRGIVSGTVSFDTDVIGLGAVSLSDDGAGTLVGGGGSGTINYSTGAYSVTFAGPVVAGAAIAARYEYNGQLSGGSSGVSIVTFSVTQEGNRLTIVDNNGSVYNGNFGSVRTTQGTSRDTPTDAGTPAVGDTVIGSFEANGTSAAGASVTITGTFQGTVGSALQIENRVILGTWIEKNGKTGDVNGAAS
jgi:hypothetical protein